MASKLGPSRREALRWAKAHVWSIQLCASDRWHMPAACNEGSAKDLSSGPERDGACVPVPAALLQQVMQLTPEQIAGLPPDQQAQVLALQEHMVRVLSWLFFPKKKLQGMVRPVSHPGFLRANAIQAAAAHGAPLRPCRGLKRPLQAACKSPECMCLIAWLSPKESLSTASWPYI